MSEFKWLIENVPVAAALIIMTKMWLSHLRASDDKTRETFKAIADNAGETFKAIADDAEERTKSCQTVIEANTEVLVQVKEVMKACCK